MKGTATSTVFALIHTENPNVTLTFMPLVNTPCWPWWKIYYYINVIEATALLMYTVSADTTPNIPYYTWCNVSHEIGTYPKQYKNVMNALSNEKNENGDE